MEPFDNETGAVDKNATVAATEQISPEVDAVPTRKRRSLNHNVFGYIFSIPFVLAYLVFHLYPTIYTAILSFTDAMGLAQKKISFLTGSQVLDNYKRILDNATFKEGFVNTFLIWIMNFIPQMLLALLLTAWFTRHRNKIRGQGFFKVVFYMPNIITAASVALLFNALLGYPVGPLNSIFAGMGFLDKPFDFLDNKIVARIVVAFIQFWMWYGYTMIILISGVLGISPEIFESADVDGASEFKTFIHITLPNLKPIMLYTLVTSLIGGLTMYDIPVSLTNGKGAPRNATLTNTIFIYNQVFGGSYSYRTASAASMLVFLVIIVLSIFVFKMLSDKDEVREKKENKKRMKEFKRAMKLQQQQGGAF